MPVCFGKDRFLHSPSLIHFQGQRRCQMPRARIRRWEVLIQSCCNALGQGHDVNYWNLSSFRLKSSCFFLFCPWAATVHLQEQGKTTAACLTWKLLRLSGFIPFICSICEQNTNEPVHWRLCCETCPTTIHEACCWICWRSKALLVASISCLSSEASIGAPKWTALRPSLMLTVDLKVPNWQLTVVLN